jgi:DNA end-binding protein Ku
MLFMDFKFGIAGSCGGCPYSPEAGGLLFCSVGVCVWPPASERVSFRQINKQTGNRLRQQLVDEVTREVVEAHDKGRGYEIAKGQYLQVEDDEIDAIQVESTHAIEIEKFVPLAEIDVRYFDNPYYLIPDDQVGLDAFAVVRDAMASKKMVGVGRVVLQKRERPILLEPFGKGIRGMTLRYPYEVRGETEYFEDIPELKIAPDMLKLAQHIVDTKAGHFQPEEFVDRYEVELVELLKTKQAGLPAKKPTPAMPRPSGRTSSTCCVGASIWKRSRRRRKRRRFSPRWQRRKQARSKEHGRSS